MDSLAPTTIEPNPNNQPMETLTLGAGCFWCVEAVFEQVKGVSKVRSGYMGGQVAQPTYREVCTGRTGHAEVVQFSFDPSVVSMRICWRFFLEPMTRQRSIVKAKMSGLNTDR